MRLDQFTVKGQEALTTAQTLAEKSDHPEVTTEHLLKALLEQEGGVVPSALGKLGVNAGGLAADVERSLASLPRAQGTATHVSPKLDATLKQALREAEALKDQYVSTEHLLLALLDGKTPAAEALEARGGHPRRAPQGAEGHPRQPDGGRPERRGPLPGPREVRPRPHRARPQGQARPRHRPRRRGPPRRPGPLPPHQEQPRPHRRAGRRQDRHRRGPRPADRQGRHPRVAQEQAGDRPRPRRPHRGRQVPRRVRGPPEGRPQGSDGVRGRGHPLHRRAAHGRGRGRGRGRDGRLEHAQADARAGRAALRGRHDAQRVPEAHREGRRPRAALPARLRGRAVRRGHDRHPARPQGALRGAPRRPHPGLRPRGRGHALEPLHRRPLPARQGHRPRGRGGLAPAHRDRLDADRDRPGGAEAHPARDRAPGAQEGVRQGLEGAPREGREGDRRAARDLGRHEGPLAAGEGGDPEDPLDQGADRAGALPDRRR